MNKKSLLFKLLIFLPLLTGAGESSFSGENLYLKHCSSCHHKSKIGLKAPPLVPPFLKRYTDADLEKIIIEGLPSTKMPAFKQLDHEQAKALIDFMRQPVLDVSWTENDIASSVEILEQKSATTKIKDIHNVTVVVERKNNKVWVMEGENILDIFDFKNVHGGLKYTSDGKRFFVPTREGWIGRYDLNIGYFGKVRACVYLRNIALSRDNKYLIAACRLPQVLVILDASNLKPVKTISLDGKISAIYSLYSKDEALFTFRDKPLLGRLNTKSLEVTYSPLADPIEDFFIDPLDKYLVGSSRKGTILKAFDLKQEKVVFEYTIEGMPHLSSAATWYDKGSFYFATSHIGKPFVTAWKMYDWSFVKKIDIGGSGFFVRTHSLTPYLWADNGTDSLSLIDKRNFTVRKETPVKGMQAMHTEFSGDGKYAYVSIYEPEGYLFVYNATTLRMAKQIPAKLPVGKYNFVNKTRKFSGMQLGKDVFMANCWGCHHTTEDAFAPSFKWIAKNRTENIIKAQIANPEKTHKLLGYKDNVMPKFDLSKEEIETLMMFIKGQVHAQNN